MIKLTAGSRTYGNNGQYIARITGRDSKYTYRREFIGRKSDRSTEAYAEEAGLYEVCDIDKKGRKDTGFVLVLPRTASCPPLSEGADPEWIQIPGVREKDGLVIAKRLDEHEEITSIVAVEKEGGKYEYRVRDRREAKQQAVAATVDSAIEHCWTVIQVLPEREAKKVLSALKARVTPKPVAQPADAAAAEPVLEAGLRGGVVGEEGAVADVAADHLGAAVSGLLHDDPLGDAGHGGGGGEPGA